MLEDNLTSEQQNQAARPVRNYEGIGILLGAMAGTTSSVALWYYDKIDYNTGYMMIVGELAIIGAVVGGVIEDRISSWYREYQDYKRK